MRKHRFLLLACALLSGCSYVLDEPELTANRSKDNQQNFEVKVTPLTTEITRLLNAQKFNKKLIVTEKDQDKLSGDTKTFKRSYPPANQPLPYRLGIGDLLELTTIISENDPVTPSPPPTVSFAPGMQGVIGNRAAPRTGEINPKQEITKARSRVSADGSVLFLETGRLNVLNKTTSDVRQAVSEALIRNGLDTRFQLELVEFNSQTVSLISYNSPVNNFNSDSEIGAARFQITERPTTLRELLVSAGLILKKNAFELVSIQRNKNLYQIPLEDIFDPNTTDYYVQGGDVVTVEAFQYQQEFAYVMGGRSQPFLIELSEEEPIPLANALFTSGGVLSSPASKKSEVYVLRGRNPVTAYHLDATDPARLTISAELELRPDDIVFAATVPIVDFNTILGLINPLRILTGQEQPLFSPAF